MSISICRQSPDTCAEPVQRGHSLECEGVGRRGGEGRRGREEGREGGREGGREVGLTCGDFL